MQRRGGNGHLVLYHLHELQRTLFSPATHLARAGVRMFSEPSSWLACCPGAAGMAAGYELLYRMGKDYEKPRFDIHSVAAHGAHVAVVEQTVLSRPFCRLQRFQRSSDRAD